MNRNSVHPSDRPDLSASRTLAWLVVTATLWAVLSDNRGWYIGAPVTLLATGLATLLDTRPWTLRLQHLPAFTAFFLYNSLLGGWDVARRTIMPSVPLSPGWVRHELHSQDPAVHLALSAIVGLLPGTLASHFDRTHLHIHLLDRNTAWRTTVERLEGHLMRVSGIEGTE